MGEWGESLPEGVDNLILESLNRKICLTLLSTVRHIAELPPGKGLPF